MDACCVDVTVEFLAVAFHNIMYYAEVYPKCVFDARKKYSVVVHRCMHPDVNSYVDRWLNHVAEALKRDSLLRVEFIVTDINEKSRLTFVFDFERRLEHDEAEDAYLVNFEQNLRAYCLLLASASKKFQGCPADSFCINMYTNESTEVSMSLMPYFQDFPLIEVRDETEETENIMPLRRFGIRNFVLDAYIEIPKPWTFLS